MIHEFFGSSEIIDKKETAVMLPKRLYKQERDWTCSIACMRSIVSSIKDLGSEESIIQKYKLSPGPYYSKDIKKLNILEGYDVKYGCDIQDKSHGLKLIYELLKNDWYMMCECLINYDHWVVVCVYFTNDEDEVSKHNIMIYDPYYNQVRLINAEEFGAMWISGEHATNNVKLDFIAVKHQ